MTTTVITDTTTTVTQRMGAAIAFAAIGAGTANVTFTLPGLPAQTFALSSTTPKTFPAQPFGVDYSVVATGSVQAVTTDVSEATEAVIAQVETLPALGQRGVIYQTLTASYWWNGAAFISMGGGAGAFVDLSVSGAASFADGTESLPSITNTGDTNTGVYFPAADTVGISAGGQAVFTAGATAEGSESLRAVKVASAVNRIEATGSVTTAGVATLSAAGTDAAIDFALAPKGAGLVRFGAATASVATVSTHQIAVKAADGTTYYLLATTVA